jgi:protein arginine N-methyltransferase 1
VDAIVSEWMGYCLVYESMLDSVIHARDRLLKPGGLMFPEKARIFIAGMNDKIAKDSADSLWLSNEYGVSMRCLKKREE